MRPFAVPVALTVLVLAAGCSGGDAGQGAVWETPKTATPPRPSASAAGVTLPADTRAACDKAVKIGTTFGSTFLNDLRLRAEAAAKGPAAKSSAQAKLDRDVNAYSAALANLSASTRDAGLKKALKQMSTQVKALKGDVSKINAKKMAALSASLDKACGRS